MVFRRLTSISVCAAGALMLAACGGAAYNWEISNINDKRIFNALWTLDESNAAFGIGKVHDASTSTFDRFAVRVGADGKLLWQASEIHDGRNENILTADDGYYVQGSRPTTSDGDGAGVIFIAKYSHDGVLLWNKDIANHGAVDSRGFYFDSLNQPTLITRSVDLYTFYRIEPTGEVASMHSVSGLSADLRKGIAFDNDNAVYMVAQSMHAFQVAKVSAEAQLLWQVTLPGDYTEDLASGFENLAGIRLDQHGDLLLAGSLDSVYNEQKKAPETQGLIYKLDGNGTLKWRHHYDPEDNALATNIEIGGMNLDANGNTYAVGKVSSLTGFTVCVGPGIPHICPTSTTADAIYKVDANGEEAWETRHDNKSDFNDWRLQFDTAGNPVVGEATYVARYDAATGVQMSRLGIDTFKPEQISLGFFALDQQNRVYISKSGGFFTSAAGYLRQYKLL